MSDSYEIYLISDSTGETLDRVFLAIKAQFKNINYNVRSYFFTRTDVIGLIPITKNTPRINDNKPGTINQLDKTGLYINTIDSVVVITYLQFPNKKIISSSDVYNSYKDFFQ